MQSVFLDGCTRYTACSTSRLQGRTAESHGWIKSCSVFPVVGQWGISEVFSMAMNQKELRTRETTTPAPMLTRVITKGTTNGKAIAPARGVMATNQRMTKKLRGESEPLGPCFMGRVAVVFWGLTLKVQRDVALLLSVNGGGFDGVDLLSIAEWNLNADGAVG